MSEYLQVEVVAKEGRLWHGVCTHVQIPVTDGSMGILPRRQPMLAFLGEGDVIVDTKDGDHLAFSVEGGFVSVDSDFVTVVADHGVASSIPPRIL